VTKPQGRLPLRKHWDFDSPRPFYFQQLDEFVEAATDRGMLPVMVALWLSYILETNQDWMGHSYHTPRHPMTEEEATHFSRYIAARYGPYGAVWFVSGDIHFPETALDVYSAVFERLAEHSPHSLCTFHTLGQDRLAANGNNEPWLDFRMYQLGHHADERQRAAFGLAEDTRGWSRLSRRLIQSCATNSGATSRNQIRGSLG